MAKKVTFFLSPPRCRTAWLSLYLTGMGVYCYHELWRDVGTMDDFKQAIDSHKGAVANADAGNWFFAKELHEAFPDAQFITLSRSGFGLQESLKRSYGDKDYTSLLNAYGNVSVALWDTLPIVSQYTFEAWTPEVSKQIWWDCRLAETPFNGAWHERMHQVEVQVTEARIVEDYHMVMRGDMKHLQRKIEACEGRSLWV